jgi:hypothetical protein
MDLSLEQDRLLQRHYPQRFSLMLLARETSVVARANDKTLFVLLKVREQLVFVALAIHHVNHRALVQLLLALLYPSHPALCFASPPSSELATTKVLFAATASRSLGTPVRLDVQDAQGPTMMPGIDDQPYVSKESRLAGR